MSLAISGLASAAGDPLGVSGSGTSASREIADIAIPSVAIERAAGDHAGDLIVTGDDDGTPDVITESAGAARYCLASAATDITLETDSGRVAAIFAASEWTARSA